MIGLNKGFLQCDAKKKCQTPVKRGETPYCQINENNISAIRLQEKLGLYLCNESMWWLRKGI